MVGIDPAADGCDVGVTMGDGMMGRVPNAPPTTVAEWVEQTRETGILEFEQLLALGEVTVDDVADNYIRGRDDEREAITTYYAELFQRAPFSVGDMLSDIRRNQHQKVEGQEDKHG